MENVMEQINNDIKVYFVRDHIEDSPSAFEVFVTNVFSGNTYEDLGLSSQSFIDEAGSSVGTAQFGILLPQNSIKVDQSDLFELDMLLAYELVLYSKNERFLIRFGLKGSPIGDLEKIVGTHYEGISVEYSVITADV